MRREVLWRIISAVMCPVFILSVFGQLITNDWAATINSVLGISTSKVVETADDAGDTIYYKSEYGDYDSDTYELYKKASIEMCDTIMEEGSTLLKNEGSALPLTSGAKVTLFGYGSFVSAYTNNLTFEMINGENITLKTALEEAGFAVNPTMWDAYAALTDMPTRGTNTYPEAAPDDVFTEETRASYDSYNDAAIFVISRYAGEGTTDISMGNGNDADSASIAIADTEVGMVASEQGNGLLLTADEKAALDEACEHFDRVIVLVNSTNAFGMQDLADNDDVDAILWIGRPGSYGIEAVARLLDGTINPSGHTTDTYAYNPLNAPATENTGNFTYTNTDEILAAYDLKNNYGSDTSYVVYQEGIYIGYKYYETRYEDTLLGQGNADGNAGVYTSSDANHWNYSEEVAYPFGYGLSYTTFAQTLKSVTFEGEGNDAYAVLQVEVENTGDTAGKDVVEVYVQTPYTDYDRENLIEKSSVELVGFEKTETIPAGGTEVVTVTVYLRDFAAYDTYGYGTYIMDAGDYYFSVGTDAHDALNNILAAKDVSGMVDNNGAAITGNVSNTYHWTVDQLDAKTYSVNYATGTEITNLFDQVDLNYYTENSVTYLSRADWQGTYPAAYTDLTATEEMLFYYDAQKYDYTPTAEDKADVEIVTDENTQYTIATLIGEDMYSDAYETLLNQMSIEEMTKLVTIQTMVEIESIALPYSADLDDGSGLYAARGHYDAAKVGAENADDYCVRYPSETNIAYSWNRTLAYEAGQILGEDCLWTNTKGMFGSGAGIHRTAYGARNYEYASEDSFLTKEIVYEFANGIQNKGVIVYMKHFLLNDQETNRLGVATFANQQSFRETHLDCWEKWFCEGGNGVMGSFSRIGTIWSNAYSNLMVDLAQEEWGFTGIITTDMCSLWYQNPRLALSNGTSCILKYSDVHYQSVIDYAKTSTEMLNYIREATRICLYNLAQSNVANGISATSVVVSITPWYTTLLNVIAWTSGMIGIAALLLVALSEINKRRIKQ